MKKLTARQVLKSLNKNVDSLTAEIIQLKITLAPINIRGMAERVSNCEAATNRMSNRLDAIEIFLKKVLSPSFLREAVADEIKDSEKRAEDWKRANIPFYDVAKDWKEPVQ